jgi:hypothetical protein
MTIETEVADLTTATNSLLAAVGVTKATLDSYAAIAQSSASSASADAISASASAALATASKDAAALAEAAATTAKNTTIAVAAGGTASLTAIAARMPLTDGSGKLDDTWLSAFTETPQPSIAPSLNLDFTKNVLDPRITFTRSSTATYVNSAGLLVTAQANSARFDYDPTTLACKGLLIEEARTNLAKYSTALSDVFWQFTVGTDTIADNAVAGLDGLPSASTYTQSTASAQHFRYQTQSGWVANSIYVLSLDVKKISGTHGIILAFGSGIGASSLSTTARGYARWDTLSSGAATASAISGTGLVLATDSYPAPNGFTRIELVFTFDSTNTNTNFSIGYSIGTGGAASTVTGDGSVYAVTHCQLEALTGSTQRSSSRIPTTTTAVTRAADSAYMRGATNFDAWFNATEGTLVGSAEVRSVVLAGRVIADISRSTSSANDIYVSLSRSTDSRRAAGVTVSTAQVDYAPAGTTTSTKIALAYALNNANAAFDGTLATLDTACTIPTSLTTLYIGNADSGLTPLNGWVKRISYYQKRIADTELLELSKA